MAIDNRAARRARTAQLLETALGSRWRVRTAQALGLHATAVRRWFTPPQGRDDAPPAALEALAEFLSETPPRSWPDRWRRDKAP